MIVRCREGVSTYWAATWNHAHAAVARLLRAIASTMMIRNRLPDHFMELDSVGPTWLHWIEARYGSNALTGFRLVLFDEARSL